MWVLWCVCLYAARMREDLGAGFTKKHTIVKATKVSKDVRKKGDACTLQDCKNLVICSEICSEQGLRWDGVNFEASMFCSWLQHHDPPIYVQYSC